MAGSITQRVYAHPLREHMTDILNVFATAMESTVSKTVSETVSRDAHSKR